MSQCWNMTFLFTNLIVPILPLIAVILMMMAPNGNFPHGQLRENHMLIICPLHFLNKQMTEALLPIFYTWGNWGSQFRLTGLRAGHCFKFSLFHLLTLLSWVLLTHLKFRISDCKIVIIMPMSYDYWDVEMK